MPMLNHNTSENQPFFQFMYTLTKCDHKYIHASYPVSCDGILRRQGTEREMRLVARWFHIYDWPQWHARGEGHLAPIYRWRQLSSLENKAQLEGLSVSDSHEKSWGGKSDSTQVLQSHYIDTIPGITQMQLDAAYFMHEIAGMMITIPWTKP
jgi:hypothetical protein